MGIGSNLKWDGPYFNLRLSSEKVDLHVNLKLQADKVF